MVIADIGHEDPLMAFVRLCAQALGRMGDDREIVAIVQRLRDNWYTSVRFLTPHLQHSLLIVIPIDLTLMNTHALCINISTPFWACPEPSFVLRTPWQEPEVIILMATGR